MNGIWRHQYSPMLVLSPNPNFNFRFILEFPCDVSYVSSSFIPNILNKIHVLLGKALWTYMLFLKQSDIKNLDAYIFQKYHLSARYQLWKHFCPTFFVIDGKGVHFRMKWIRIQYSEADNLQYCSWKNQ